MDLILSILLVLLPVDTISWDHDSYDLQPNGWYFPDYRREPKDLHFQNYQREESNSNSEEDGPPDSIFYEAPEDPPFKHVPMGGKRAINDNEKRNLLHRPMFSFDLHDKLVFGEVEEDSGETKGLEWSPPAEEVMQPGMGGRQTICEDECKTTMQYDPMCGDNGRTYYNNQRLLCAQKCGIDVSLLHHGRCV